MAWPFALAADEKAMLWHGFDAIDLTLRDSAAIAEWTARDRVARPWVYEVNA